MGTERARACEREQTYNSIVRMAYERHIVCSCIREKCYSLEFKEVAQNGTKKRTKNTWYLMFVCLLLFSLMFIVQFSSVQFRLFQYDF